MLLHLLIFRTLVRSRPGTKKGSEGGFEASKLGNQIAIPHSVDLSCMFLDSASCKAPSHHYELQGILFHEGPSPRSGHYLSRVRSAGLWYECDDGQIRPMTPDAAVKYEATHSQGSLAGRPKWMPLVLLYSRPDAA